MDEFLNHKKHTSTTNCDAEETGLCAKMLKSDAEYSAIAIGHPSKKLKKNDTAPADISQSAGGNPIYENILSTVKERDMLGHF